MSQSADEARAARIQKYKEERRKQLTARTATLFSANVTERRPKKAANRSPLEDTVTNLKSSSEINLNTASTSVPIRTTRTSRLRAAATSSGSDSCQSPKKSIRSSSVLSLLEEEKNKTPKNAKIVDRDKTRLNSSRKQSHEKENLKSPSTTSFPDKDNGAIRSKLKHSSNKNILEKDKSNCLVSSFKGKIVDEKNCIKLDERKNRISLTDESKINCINDDEKSVNVDDILNDILGDKNLSNNSEKDKFEDLYNDLVDDNTKIEIHVNDAYVEDDTLPQETELKSSNNSSYIPIKKTIAINKTDNTVKVEKGVVPKVVRSDVGLLGAVCVRKVERFSELLSNLCSPCEADILFEDILVENGIDGENSSVSKK
ncbi:unnamed protein product [Euphydryas editha]|uniref:Uncharacterized protein n=1 Tax=Euphydryas editha TaxID=104508 RepID=A0AAU9TZG1_EUPED|nr:unnamed protein product [Euphydryas editha]